MDKDTYNHRERRIRTAGTAALIAGAFTAAATIIGAVLWREDHTTELPTVAVVAGLGLAYVLGLLGGLERLNRPSRKQQATICAKLEHLEAALQRIAATLPGELHRQNWLGFTSAVEQGFADTGTDGTTKNSTALTLVHRTDPGT